MKTKVYLLSELFTHRLVVYLHCRDSTYMPMANLHAHGHPTHAVLSWNWKWECDQSTEHLLLFDMPCTQLQVLLWPGTDANSSNVIMPTIVLAFSISIASHLFTSSSN